MSGSVDPAMDRGPADVAAFDFDDTLLRGDSVLILHRLIKGPLLMLLDWLALVPALLSWKSGRRDTLWFKERYLRRILAGCEPSRLESLLTNDLAQELMGRLRPEALRRLEWHRARGDRLLIISASPRPLLEPVAQRLAVALIATEMEGAGACLRLTSPNCKGPEKVRRLEAWLAGPTPSVRLHAYGDSRGDRELLARADQPHWRSFSERPVPYPRRRRGVPLQALATLLLAVLVCGLVRLPESQRSALVLALGRLPLWLPMLYGVLALVLGLRYWRWRLLLGGYGIGGWSRLDALGWFRGFALTATPGKLGELVRVHELHHALGYPRNPLLQIFVLERGLDALAVMLWLLLLAPAVILAALQRFRPPAEVGATAFALLGLLGAGALVLLLRAASRPLNRLLQHLRRGWPADQGSLFRNTLAAALVSLLIWACEPLILWILVRALSPASLPVTTTTAIYLLSGTAGMVSSLPGGLGVNEAATVLLLAQQGVSAGIGLPIAIIRRLITPWSIVALASSIAPLRSTDSG